MTVAQHAEDDVLIIGAGPAGIASAYALEQANISYKVIDRADVIASTWHHLYPSLELNTSRFFSHMTGKTFPTHYGIFPTGRQYYDYLLDYVRDHNFNIHLGVEVQRVTPQGDYWRVETDNGTWLYPAVISATGIFGSPLMPQIAGMDEFTGRCFHAHDFKNPEQVTGQKVLVVGNGPSGVDISVACADTADTVHIAIRSGVKLKRRYPLGLPKHAWLLVGQYLPDAWCKRLMSYVGKFGFPEQARYGLNPPEPGEGGMTAYQGPELLDAVKAGKVYPVPGLKRFDASGVTFVDGQYHEFDTVIMATGYEPVLHQYMDVEFEFNDDPWEAPSPCDWQVGPNGQRGWPLRDTIDHPNGRQIKGHPGLYLVGTFYKGKGAMFNMNVEAKIAADQIRSYLRWRGARQATAAAD